MYRVTKTYGHERGISCAFRQWKANSHCNQIHGYALSFSFVFESATLNDQNWVIDFGGLKDLENQLKDHFDHKLAIARDDPKMYELLALRDAGLADIVVMPHVGCEAFARYAYTLALPIIHKLTAVRIVSVTVSEHGANSATYIPTP